MTDPEIGDGEIFIVTSPRLHFIGGLMRVFTQYVLNNMALYPHQTISAKCTHTFIQLLYYRLVCAL